MLLTEPGPSLRGDLHARADGGFDGWCWAPDRPQERLVVELLVNDTLALSMVAAMFRRDLLALGCGDGRHGFALRLPPDPAWADTECLITARERKTGKVFGRVLRAGPGHLPPTLARLAVAADEMAALGQQTAALHMALTVAPVAARLRRALGRLGGELARRAAQRRAPWASGVTTPLRSALAAAPAPLLTVILCAGGRAATLARIRALAPALATLHAEVLVADATADAATALLPAMVPNLRYLRDPAADHPGRVLRLAAGVAHGRFLLLLDATSAAPSAAALLALARAVAADPAALLLADAVADAASALAPVAAHDTLRLPAPLGVLIGGERDLWPQLGADAPGSGTDATLACADLALRARLLGRAWRRVGEPAAPSPALPPPTAAAGALGQARQMHARWGFRA